MVFHAQLAPWLDWRIDRARLEESVAWKEMPGGVRFGKLKRDGETGLVLYHVAAECSEEAFLPHTHTGGEMYLVLEGSVSDDSGTYPTGSLVWMPPGSRHRPTTDGDTLILVLWPKGVEG